MLATRQNYLRHPRSATIYGRENCTLGAKMFPRINQFCFTFTSTSRRHRHLTVRTPEADRATVAVLPFSLSFYWLRRPRLARATPDVDLEAITRTLSTNVPSLFEHKTTLSLGQRTFLPSTLSSTSNSTQTTRLQCHL